MTSLGCCIMAEFLRRQTDARLMEESRKSRVTPPGGGEDLK
jgi:hypothetical protein